MTYERFLKITLGLQKQDRVVSNAYDLKVDLLDFVDPYHVIITELIKEVYGEEGYDWWSWFCYENNFGNGGLTANDKDGTPICYSHESLWEYLEKEYNKPHTKAKTKSDKKAEKVSLDQMMRDYWQSQNK